MCGLWWPKSRSLTVVARPLHSSTESGGPPPAAASGGQTGNSGVIPGRPRRCIQAFETGCHRAIGFASFLRRTREGGSRSSLGVRRPTSFFEQAKLRGQSGRHGHGNMFGSSSHNRILLGICSIRIAPCPSMRGLFGRCAVGAHKWTPIRTPIRIPIRRIPIRLKPDTLA